MKVAVLSDIHSNYPAFQACYEDAVMLGADRFLFLGDYVSDLAQPCKTMDQVYEIRDRYPTVCLRGNREGYMLDWESGIGSFSRGSKSGSLLFTYEKLRKKDLDFFRGLKISDTVVIGGIPMEIAHAAMDSDRFYFDSDDGNTAGIFPKMKCNYLLTGHSHRQYIQREGNKTIINPGSVGMPHGAAPLPQYALLEVDNGEVSCTLRQVAYDVGEAIRSQFAEGLVDYARYWAIGVLYDILTGEEWVLRLLNRVREAGDIHDERNWQQAAADLSMKCTEQALLKLYRECSGESCIPEL